MRSHDYILNTRAETNVLLNGFGLYVKRRAWLLFGMDLLWMKKDVLLQDANISKFCDAFPKPAIWSFTRTGYAWSNFGSLNHQNRTL